VGEKLQVPKGQKVLKAAGYRIRWYEGKKQCSLEIGEDLQEAITARDHQISVLEAERAAAAAGLKLGPERPAPADPPEANRVRLTDARDRFIEKKRLVDRDPETVTQYENLIRQFLEVSRKKLADEVEEIDLLRFCDTFRRRGCQERTVENCYTAIASFLLRWGIDHKNLLAKEHRPTSQDSEPR
jgi:Phage integrase, N-terminal SAM-like domain